MAIRNPINLGQPRMTIGQLPPDLMMKQAQQGGANPQHVVTREARDLGLADVLGQEISVESGGWGEAVAEALAAGLRGRAASRLHQDELGDETREQKREDARRNAISQAVSAFGQGGDINAIVAGLSDGAPEEGLGLATALMGREPQSQWSEPYDMNGVSVQRNSRDNQVRPVVTPNAAMIYQPPAGYTGTPEGLAPIRGGPADVRATAEGRSRMQQLESSGRQLDNAIAVLDEALPNISGYSAGFMGGMTRGVPGSAAYNLNQQLEPVRAILSFENLAEMRRNSATGGALGSIAVRELELLGNTVRSLDTAQSEEQLRAAVQATREQLARTREAVTAAQQEMTGGQEQEAPIEGAPPQQRLRWNPQTGRLE